MPGRAAKQYDAGVPANQGREDDAASARLVNQPVCRAPRAGAHACRSSRSVQPTTTRRRQGGRADAVSWGCLSAHPGRGLVGHEPSSNTPDFCVAANTWATRWRAHQAVAADEVLGLRLTRRGGLQPLRELPIAHAFVVPGHAAVGGDGQVRHVGLDRLHSIQTQILMRIIIDCPWFCVIWQHRWNNPALPGHSQPRQRLKAGWRQLESLCDRHRHREALMRFPTARGMDSTFWGGST